MTRFQTELLQKAEALRAEARILEIKAEEAALVNPREHRVFYKATQVERSAGCFQRPALRVGMSVAILETRQEFCGDAVPTPIFKEAKVINISGEHNSLVKFKYKHSVNSAVELIAGVKEIEPFCVILKK